MKSPEPIKLKPAKLDFLIVAAWALLLAIQAASLYFMTSRGADPWLIGAFSLSLLALPFPARSYYLLRRLVRRRELEWESFSDKSRRLRQAVAERTANMLLKQRQLQSFIDNVEAGAYLKNARHEFTLVNPRLCSILGVASVDLLNSTGYSVLPRAVAWRMMELEQQAAREGQSVELDDLFESAGYGGRVHSLHLFPVINPKGQIEGAGGLLFDVTERRRLSQAIIEAKEAAERANQAKNSFLANISHEIRTPLNGIIGMADLLLRGKLTDDQGAMVKTVKTAGRSLLAVLNDVLDLSKIEAGKMSLENIPFSPRDLIFEAATGLAPLAANKDLEIIVDIGPEIPARLSGDQNRLRQIILNLLSNALKFTSRGEISVSLEILGYSSLGDADEDIWAQALLSGPGRAAASSRDCVKLRFTVSDTGIGIPLEKQELIFQPFEQADASTTRTHGGTGLGLPICCRLLNMMNSRLNLQSQVEQGSVFWFDLRLDIAAADQADPAGRLDAPSLAGRSVLLTDDNPNVRRLIAEELKRLGLLVTEAAGADEALSCLRRAAAEEKPFELLITDYMMPGRNGLALLKDLRDEPRLNGIPALLMTLSDVPAAHRPHFSAILAKPVRPPALARAVAAALNPAAPGETRAEDAPPEASAAPEGLHILLVEDMEMNRTVAVRLLSELGHKTETAANGAQALALLEAGGGFDMALMDIQMPVMDGLETTVRLRRLEAQNGWPRLPVAAMTANAMKGDREKYLDLGLDDYIAKPILFNELIALIERLRGRRPEDSKPRDPETTAGAVPAKPLPAGLLPASENPLDEELIKRTFGGNERLLAKSMAIYMRDAPGLLREIKAALDADEPRRAASPAHALKGISGYYTNSGAFELARRLDRMAQSGPYPEIKPELEALAEALSRSVAALMAAMTRRLEPPAGPAAQAKRSPNQED